MGEHVQGEWEWQGRGDTPEGHVHYEEYLVEAMRQLDERRMGESKLKRPEWLTNATLCQACEVCHEPTIH